MDRDPYTNLSGPRLPYRVRRDVEPLGESPDAAVDKAHGEKVTRCRTCGRPAIGLEVYEFTLMLGRKIAGTYRLCADCFRQANPFDPQKGDPLQLEEAC